MTRRRYPPELRNAVLGRLRSGERVAAVAADTGVSQSTLYRWRRADATRSAPMVTAAPGKLADITGPGITDRFGVTGTDLGASIIAPNGKLVSVFGDTFSGERVGEGQWRSPVVLIGAGDAHTRVSYEQAGGSDPDFAHQLWDYVHDTEPRWARGGISTVIPSDLLRVDDTVYLHAIVNRGFGNVTWTEIWQSDDSGVSWQHMGPKAKFPGDLHGGHAQCWSWDYDPNRQWVYVVSTGFQRDKGIILRRVRPEDIGDIDEYEGWGWANDRWGWGNEPTPITPVGETWGELCLRRLDKRTWVLGGFLSSKYAVGYRTIETPTANLHTTEIQLPITGSGWDDEDHANGKVAQPYGGYLLPGSRLDVPASVGLVVSQWNTEAGWPYRAMQFRATLADTTPAGRQRRGEGDINL